MQDNKQQLHETMDWFQTGKVASQGCILSPCLFNSYAEYITGNPRLDEAQFQYQFSRSVMSNFLQLHGPQHTRPPCPSPAPGVYSNSCPLSQLTYPRSSPLLLPLSQHQGLFQSVSSSHIVAKVLELQLHR